MVGFGTRSESMITNTFNDGRRYGIEQGIQTGLQQHFSSTSELTDAEDKLLIQFLVRHNFVMCQTPDGGFCVRNNTGSNPHPEKRIFVVDKSYRHKNFIEAKSVTLVEKELMDMDLETIK